MPSTLLRLFCLLLISFNLAVAAPERWKDEIATLIKNDATQPPASDAVLFVGSSSIRLWKSLADDFPGVPVINRGFGGSEIADSLHYADQIILPYRPRAIVLYSGENDIAGGKPPEAVAADFKTLREKIHQSLPAAHLYYLSIKFSPSRAKLKALMDRANQLIAADCSQAKNCTFVDVNSAMLDAAGEPRPELFIKDQLHMRPEGYAIWKKILAPLLQP
jgi:lysophospholipase L1-like esterase